MSEEGGMKMENFLPNSMELEEMELEDFEFWVHEAKRVIPKRMEQREPLVHLKKKVTLILQNPALSEKQREAHILSEIERYEYLLNFDKRH